MTTSHTTGRSSGVPSHRWTQADDDTLRSLHGQGLPCNEIARRMEFTSSVISQRAAKLELSFDRHVVEAANNAWRADGAANRRRLVERMTAQAHAALDDVEDNARQTLIKGAGGSEQATALGFVPTRDRRDISDTVSRYAASIARLEALDDDNGVADAISVLGRLARAIGLVDEVDDTTDDATT